jgi:CubicO group peptidase (beta-lactamase class C family)
MVGEKLVARARREIDAGLLPSCQLALARDGEVILDITLGDPGIEGPPESARYLMYSSTKALTAGAVWQLLADGSLKLDTRAGDVIPEFATNGKEVVTVEQLLLHTAGFPMAPLGPPDWASREKRLERFAKWRLNWEPGTRFEYHPSAAHWVLAELIERVTGTDFRQVIHERVLDPLGLHRLRVGVPRAEQGDIAPVSTVGEPPTAEELEAALGIANLDPGEVTDAALVTLGQPENLEVGVPGGGGVGPASEMALYYQALLHNPGGLWDPEWLADATGRIRCTLPDPMIGVPANRSLGLGIAGDDGQAAFRQNFGRTCSPRTFGHAGAGGQIAWADPETGLSFVYFTNGLDAHVLRQGRRGVALSSLAAVALD